MQLLNIEEASPHFSHLSSQNARNSTLEVFFHYEGAIALL
jgi:hypothetical protein